jgi:Flp pilus assembly protein TadG
MASLCRVLGGRRIATLRADRRGAVAVVCAMLLTPILTVSAIVVDMGLAHARQIALQQAADAAALAGALAYSSTSSTSSMMATVQDVVQANGWAASTIQSPGSEYLSQSPQNSAYSAVRVTLVAPSPVAFGADILHATSVNLRAVSLVELRGNSVCILSLTTLIVNGTINAPTCGVAANSTSSQAILVNGSGKILAKSVSTSGGVTDNGNISPTPKTYAAAVADPYHALQSVAAAGFTGCQNYNNQTTLTPGCWQNVNVNSGTLTLQSGTFFFTGLNINSGGSLTGTAAGGVTIVLQNNFSPSGPITITAPTTGTWAGVAIYLSQGMNINSGVSYKINGAIYSPSTSNTLIPDAGSWNQNACTTIVAGSITFNSTASFTLPQTGCSSTGGGVVLTQ